MELEKEFPDAPNEFLTLTDDQISIDNLKTILTTNENLIHYLSVVRDDSEWTRINCNKLYNYQFFCLAHVVQEKKSIILIFKTLKLWKYIKHIRVMQNIHGNQQILLDFILILHM